MRIIIQVVICIILMPEQIGWYILHDIFMSR